MIVNRTSMNTINKEVLKYAFVGLINTALTALLIYSCMQVGFGIYLSNAFGYIFGVIISYLLNTIITFKKTLSWIRLIKFLIVCFLCWILNVISISIFLLFFPEEGYLSQLIGMIVYTLSGFVINKIWVMR